MANQTVSGIYQIKNLINNKSYIGSSVDIQKRWNDHINKLKIEADEILSDPGDLFEYSDCLLALFAAAYKAGFTYENIEDASRIKLEILKSRKWGKLDDGTYQHIKV